MWNTCGIYVLIALIEKWKHVFYECDYANQFISILFISKRNAPKNTVSANVSIFHPL